MSMHDVPGRLDAMFAPGPDGFLEDRLAAYVAAVQPTDVGAGKDEEAHEKPQEGDTKPKQADSWRAEAARYVRGLWRRSTADHEAVWGTPPPRELVAFERATLGAVWWTFHELGLDVRRMANPPEDKNLFEMLVLNDQLAYLGTGLPEAFGGVTCFGWLGNGDTYHLDLRPGGRAVMRWGHDEHAFSTLTDSLGCLVYLAALCRAHEKGLVSESCARDGYRALRRRIAPSWHFDMETRDAGFENCQDPAGQSVRFLHERARWIMSFLRQDGVNEVSDLKELFDLRLNTALDVYTAAERMEERRKFAPSALYAMWRAYLFDEPELETYLAVGRSHGARLARDAAKLIDQLVAGRNTLGRIADMRRLVERLRALNLDPRRAAERAQAGRAAKERARAARERVAAMPAEDLERFVWANVEDPVACAAAVQRVLDDPARAEARRGIDLLRARDYLRHRLVLKEEMRDACMHVAKHADSVLQALVVGEALAPIPEDGSADGEPDEVVQPSITHAFEILSCTARAGRLDERALPSLRRALAVPAFEDHVEWQLELVIDVVGRARDRGSVPALSALLERLPADGEERKYDRLIISIAGALRRIGDPAGGPALVRFAASRSTRMCDERAECGLSLALLAPDAATPAVLDGMVDLATISGSSEPDAAALLAFGIIAAARPAREHAGLAERLSEVKARAANYVEVQLAQAAGLRLLGRHDADVETLLARCLTEPGWREEYTVLRRRFAIAVFARLPVVPAELLLPLLAHRDEDLTDEVLPLLAEHGVAARPPAALTWLTASRASLPELLHALADESMGGRQHAVRALAAHRCDATTRALEQVLETSLARAPLKPDALLADDDPIGQVYEVLRIEPGPSTLALFNRLLLHPNRILKSMVLKNPPNDAALLEGMRSVAAEQWSWGEQAARKWLEENAAD